jgi:hypothetical protein
VGVLDAFMSTWSTARETFGQGVPQTGEKFDQSGTLRQLQTTVESAAPGSRWNGTAATAYQTANADHGKVFAHLASLDQRLGAQVTASSHVVTAGRENLDAVRKWVVDAANSVPPGKNCEQMLMPIVQKGLGQITDIVMKSNGDLSTIGGEIRTISGEYDALGNQKFAPKEGVGNGGPNRPTIQAVDFPQAPPPEDPDAKDQTGGYGSYHYSYPFSTSESWTQQQIAQEVMQNYNKYFTFTGDKPSIVLGEQINLDGPAGPEPVKVTQATDHGFQFVSLPGHSEGPGRVINFDIVPAAMSPVPGRLNWELRVEASGPVSGVSAIPGASWLNKGIWQVFADNLGTRLPTSPPASGPVSV